MVKRIYKQAAIAVVFAAALSSPLGWKVWPLSVIVGGLLGLANLKAMAWGIEGLIRAYKASGILVFFSMLRLFLILLIITGLLAMKLVNILGILVGFTIIFVFIIKEGLVYAKEES